MYCLQECREGVLVIRRPTKLHDIVNALTKVNPGIGGLQLFEPDHVLRGLPLKLCPTCERWNFDYKPTPWRCRDCTKLRDVGNNYRYYGDYVDEDDVEYSADEEGYPDDDSGYDADYFDDDGPDWNSPCELRPRLRWRSRSEHISWSQRPR